MIEKLKSFVCWMLESKVGNGFAFIMYSVMVLFYGLIAKAPFLEVSGALFAGLGVQTGQRTYTKVSLTKAELKAGTDPGKGLPNG